MSPSVRKLCALLLLLAVPAAPAAALVKSGGRYDVTTKAEPDARAGGWFINLGITGARGRMLPAAPRVMEVAYVFEDTPAHGKLKAGDRIVGANGKRFATPHKFGYGMDKFGYEGPMMDIGNALEASQGRRLRGKLVFLVERGGKTLPVALKLPVKYGRYAKTYPFGCRKTALILDELYAYLVKRQRDNGTWSGRCHINAFAALALLASDRKDCMPAVKKAMRFFAENTNDTIAYRGYDCWKYGLYGVCLAEYYLKTREKWVLKELDEINRWLVKAQFEKAYRRGQGAGGWGHRPAGRPGGNGYGPICMISAQAMAAWSLIARCGLEVDRRRYMLAHRFLVKGTNNIGYVWYKDGNGGDDKYADMGRTGASAAAHALCPFGGKAFGDYALKSARCIGTNYKTFPDTHGSPILGMGWTALGAALDPASFRKLMDRHVWFFNLSHCPDGTFYYQPNRDSNPQDYASGPRLSASAATALIFSIQHRSLRVTGAK
jgi:hypothetical protein